MATHDYERAMKMLGVGDGSRCRPKSGAELMTNYELAQWLAFGCGQKRNSPDAQIRMFHNYFPEEEDEEVDNKLRIRRWGDDAWMIPTQIIFYEDMEASE